MVRGPGAAWDAEPTDPALLAPPPGVRLRRPTWADLDAVVALYNACALDRIGEQPWARQDIHQRWLRPHLLDDALLGVDQDTGLVVAYAEFHADHDPWTDQLDLYLEGRVHPAATGRGLATFLLARATDRARRAGAQAPHQPELTLRTTLADADARAQAFFAKAGFRPTRHFLELRIDLTDPPPAPAPPPGVRVRTFIVGRDERATWRTLQRAFADHWSFGPTSFDDWRAITLDRHEQIDPSLWLLAEQGPGHSQPVGVALCRAGLGADPDVGYVRELGVVPAARGRGIATALLRTAFATFHERGLRRAGLEVDDVTLDGALRLYVRAGMRVARRTDVYERDITPASTQRPEDRAEA